MFSSLIAIASFVAVVGVGGWAYWLIERRLKEQGRGTSTHRPAAIAQVESPPRAAEPTLPSAPVAEAAVVPPPQPTPAVKVDAPTLPDPWLEEATPVQEPLPEQEPLSAAASTPEPVDSPEVTVSAKTEPAPVPGADLGQTIQTWGASGQLRTLPLLARYTTHPSPQIRSAVAQAVAKIAARQPLRTELEAAIPVLGKLSQDHNLEVRQAAVQALGQIQSAKVLPYLQQALKHPAGGVGKAASTAIARLKLLYQPKTAKPPIVVTRPVKTGRTSR